MSKWVAHGELDVYHDQWFHLTKVDVEQPDGRRIDHLVGRMRPAAVVAVVDADRRVLMMWRHRFVFDRWGWELPGGYIEAGETPAMAAAREVEEETGWRPLAVEQIVAAAQPLVGMIDCEHTLFLARGAVRTSTEVDPNEADHVAWIPLAAVPGMIRKGELWNVTSLVPLLFLLAEPGF